MNIRFLSIVNYYFNANIASAFTCII